MSQHAGTPLTEEVRFRLPLPIVIPLVALIVIAVTTVGMSRILLAVPKEVAVIIAIAVAMNVLIACAVLAARPQDARRSWPELFIVFSYPVLIGIVLTQLDLGAGHAVAEHEGAQGAEAQGGEGGETAAEVLSVRAAGTAFDTEQLALKAGEETELEFLNEDAQPHNLSIYESEGGELLFEGQIIPAGQQTTYQIDPLEPGKFYFQCDLHPSMNGTATVK
ncbi:MAG: cupredoxin domain-containing protein [Actinomycetota bacterium]|nr:cupredoxin domain-containing protein [Actinomycetota bacterium]